MSKTSRNRYKNSVFTKILYAIVLSSPAVYSLTRFYRGTVDSLPSTIFLAAGLVLAPLALVLIVKHLSFSVSVEDSLLSIRTFGVTRKMHLDDIVSVRLKRMNLILESVYVRDKAGRTFSFERGVSDYERLKELLLDALESNLVRRQDAVRGSHAYSLQYKVMLSFFVAGVWALFLTVFPHRVLIGNFSSKDLDTVVVGLILLLAAILGSIVAIGDSQFQLLVEDDRVRARRFGHECVIDFANAPKASVSRLGPIETMSIEDISSGKIVFNRYLEDYEGVKRFISRRVAANAR